MSTARDGDDWSILRKILITTTTGAVAYLLTNLAEQEKIWAITMSVFVAGVVLVVQFLVDFDSRLRRRTRLSGLVETSAGRTDPAMQLMQHWTQMDHNAPTLVLGFARWSIEQTSELLRELSEGLATYPAEDWIWLFGLTENAEKTIDATSLHAPARKGRGIEEGFWDSDQGRQYLQMQRRALQRGVRIRRIFILDSPADASDALMAQCRLQTEMGVDVRILDPSVIDGPDKNSHSDFIVFDGVLSYETFSAVSFEKGTQPLIFATHLERRPKRVDRRKAWFESLWNRAEGFGEVHARWIDSRSLDAAPTDRTDV